MDDMSGLKKITESSQTEIVNSIRQMRNTLVQNWQQNKRVESIVVRYYFNLCKKKLTSADDGPSQNAHFDDDYLLLSASMGFDDGCSGPLWKTHL